MDQTAHNLQQQIELYGETLGDVGRRVAPPLGLTQSALAQVIGLSAPMLSQLMSAQRVKIGNPAVVARLRAVSQLADLAIAGEIEPADIPAELDRIRAVTGAVTGAITVAVTDATTTRLRRASGNPAEPATTSPAPPMPFANPIGLTTDAPNAAWPTGVHQDPAAPLPARVVVRQLQDLLRDIASADEIQRAAAAAATESPAIADFLLAYGTGRTADALSHYEQHHT
ncbi:DNA-binding protein [Kribbella sp. NPDC004875]|uniref:DNA-binding protein n=1 Tax=Kribbella sp. NPDC004875 TaxID=3364107 RepID=UPI0036906C19